MTQPLRHSFLGPQLRTPSRGTDQEFEYTSKAGICLWVSHKTHSCFSRNFQINYVLDGLKMRTTPAPAATSPTVGFDNEACKAAGSVFIILPSGLSVDLIPFLPTPKQLRGKSTDKVVSLVVLSAMKSIAPLDILLPCYSGSEMPSRMVYVGDSLLDGLFNFLDFPTPMDRSQELQRIKPLISSTVNDYLERHRSQYCKRVNDKLAGQKMAEALLKDIAMQEESESPEEIDEYEDALNDADRQPGDEAMKQTAQEILPAESV
ncbi:unnamed protein product [Caenorhabditis auriculariae]|uniref:Uncharacterized protein n=1 Tax=Caenorhabditis auriculariae TaxID=2777116 RepID=A0A8S1HIE0_9PELO|nr:unnamed protein product [Caenorhabditis auriculariae]